MKKLILLLLVLCAVESMGQVKVGGPAKVGGAVQVGTGIAACTTTTCAGLTFRQGCNNVNTGTTVTCVFGSNLTANSILLFSGGNVNSATISFSGCGLTWTDRNPINANPSWGQATAPNSGTGACTVTLTSTVSGFIPIQGVELSGSAAQLIDVSSQVNAGQVTTPNPISGTAITTTVANDVVVQVVSGFATTGDVYTAGSGAIIYQGTGNGIGFAFQWQKQATAASVNPTITSSVTDFFIVGNVAIEP